jgi:hypothetical protein
MQELRLSIHSRTSVVKLLYAFIVKILSDIW